MTEEIWDILDETGQPTGRTISRSSWLKEGEYHLVVHVWIIDENGWVLVQRRSASVGWMPGLWAATGGSAIQGEDSITAAIRETQEELGLKIYPEQFRLYLRQKRQNDFTDIWIVNGNRAEFASLTLCEEVADAGWFTPAELISMIESGDFVKYDYAVELLRSLNLQPNRSEILGHEIEDRTGERLNFLKLAKQRCSIRAFDNRQIEREKLDYILEAGHVAPTACNRQPQRIIVVQQDENIARVHKAYNTFGSRCILIICRDTRGELVRPFDNKCSGDLDIGIVTDHLMLAAREKGIGSVMVGLFDPGIIRQEFDLPEYIEPTALLIIGYPRDGFSAQDRHATERKPLRETVMFEQYTEQTTKSFDKDG